MPVRHIALATLVAALWGVNFVIVDVALRSFPPLLLSALRFTLVAVPAIVVFRRPPVALRWLVGVGLFLSAAHFGLLFVAMDRGMPAGLASLVMQLQVVFTIALGVAVLGERPTPLDLIGGAIALAGLGVVTAGRRSAVPLVAMALCVSAAASWAVGNLCTKRAKAPDAFALLVWSSLVPPVPLLGASLAVEGPTAITEALTTLDVAGIFALLYIVVLSTLVGFGLWAWLLRRHAISSVAPYTLLVPIVGIAAAWAALGERPTPAEAAGTALVLAGSAVTVSAASRVRRPSTRRP